MGILHIITNAHLTSKYGASSIYLQGRCDDARIAAEYEVAARSARVDVAAVVGHAAHACWIGPVRRRGSRKTRTHATHKNQNQKQLKIKSTLQPYATIVTCRTRGGSESVKSCACGRACTVAEPLIFGRRRGGGCRKVERRGRPLLGGEEARRRRAALSGPVGVKLCFGYSLFFK